MPGGLGGRLSSLPLLTCIHTLLHSCSAVFLTHILPWWTTPAVVVSHCAMACTCHPPSTSTSQATVSNLLAANNLQDESDNSIFSNVLNAAAPALSFTATKAAQTKALGATFHRISDNTGVLGPQPASPGAGAGPGAGNVYSNKVSSALFKLDPLGDAGDKFTNSELSAVGCVLDVARWVAGAWPLLTAYCTAQGHARLWCCLH